MVNWYCLRCSQKVNRKEDRKGVPEVVRGPGLLAAHAQQHDWAEDEDQAVRSFQLDKA